MASDREIFGVTGPIFLTALDWHNSHHRTSIAASLVQGVYVLECDREQNREGSQGLAPPWWEFFGFKLIQTLVDDKDMSCFGAIYEFNFPYPLHNYQGQSPPQYVIAFRGMINKSGNRSQDLKMDLQCIINNDLQESRRVQIGTESTRNIVSRVGPGKVWLAGHALGSSIALLIGRQMAKNMGTHLESYLFNPPFASAPLERIKNEKVKFGVRLANSVVTAGLAFAASTSANNSKADPFAALCSWIPYLFVNPSDPICSEYVGYFEHREKMEAFGVGKIGKLATKHSIGSIVSGARGKDGEAVHLIPCAYLTINCTSAMDFKEAHGIHQWWRRNMELKYKLYQYK